MPPLGKVISNPNDIKNPTCGKLRVGFLILLGYHAVKKALAERGGLADRFPVDAKTGLLVAADGAGIPGTHLQIKGLAGKQAPRKRTGGFGHLPAMQRLEKGGNLAQIGNGIIYPGGGSRGSGAAVVAGLHAIL